MNDTQLKNLLRNADAAHTISAGEPGTMLSVDTLETAVGRRRALRRRLVGIGSSGAMVLVMAAAWWLAGDRGGTTVAHDQGARDAETFRTERTAIKTEIQSRRLVVAGLRQAREADLAAAELARVQREVGPAPQLRAELAFRRQIDRTAIISLTYADRLTEELNDPAAAAVEYRQIAQRYRETHWAATATRRLAQIEPL